MTYKEQFVAEVKCNGKILRVKDDAVFLPFGSEYSLYLKNLSSRKVSLKIHIDGQDVLDYSSLILEPNSSTELEGFLSGSIAKNKFKFIQKTKEIQDHRGDKIDDGLIRIEFAFEKPRPEVIKQTIITEHEHHRYDHHHYHEDWWPRRFDWTYCSGNVGGAMSNFTVTSSGSGGTQNSGNTPAGDVKGLAQDLNQNICFASCDANIDSVGIESLGQPLNDEGITVKGSECNQAFRYGSIGELEQSNVIIIRMKGMAGASGGSIQTPITIQTKLTCKTCGTNSKSSFKFCPSCGTFLE